MDLSCSNDTEMDVKHIVKCPPHALENEQSRTYKLAHGYYIEFEDTKMVVFTCFYNFHLISGDLVHRCSENGTWVGVEPYCEVDYYMERYRLSGFIIGLTSLICVFFLSLDLLLYMRRKDFIRGDRQRYQFFDEWRQQAGFRERDRVDQESLISRRKSKLMKKEISAFTKQELEELNELWLRSGLIRVPFYWDTDNTPFSHYFRTSTEL